MHASKHASQLVGLASDSKLESIQATCN